MSFSLGSYTDLDLLRASFNGRSVLITGHTGFKGSWLAFWLVSWGARVSGISLEPSSTPNHFVSLGLQSDIVDYRVDIRDRDALNRVVKEANPDFVFHLAAQALVLSSYIEPVTTYETNVIGTLNILESLRELQRKCSVVLVTSDKCYENEEWVWGYRETDRLGGVDPYSASKAAAEIVIRSHIKCFFKSDNSDVSIGVARAGNVIGGGDWSENRLVPDCIRSWAAGKQVALRSPDATRPWQHVLEPLSGYLLLASRLSDTKALHGEAFNFGPPANSVRSVRHLVEGMRAHWRQVTWTILEEVSNRPYESSLLQLNCDKANAILGWKPTLTFLETLRLTADWYRSFYEVSNDCRTITKEQIEYFEHAHLERNERQVNNL